MEKNRKKSDIALREEEILKFWQDNKIFEKSLKKESPKGEFVFYDGPPFATGLPHYGHILAGTIKDVIPRYKTMKGYSVRRQWGWDCHGLPLENEIEQELGFKSKKEIEEYGIDKFNEKARNFVLRYADDWQRIIPRLGRWVDMSEPYKTMDSPYTETVLYIFKKLYKKKLVYEGFKSMHLCPRCGTTLSNFEVNQGYKDIVDISVTAKFELEDEPGTYLLAWTTTPWTLPGNTALAVGEDLDYIKIKNDDGIFVLGKDALQRVFKEGIYEKLEEVKGKELVGRKYKPVFDYYSKDKSLENSENGWKVYGAEFVTTEDGTGIVHIAPAFGEDDLFLGQEKNLPIIHHVDPSGRFKEEVKAFKGLPVKPKGDHQSADIEVIKYLAGKNLLLSKEKITHSYPHCWRCETPLLNYATSSWFVRVSELKDRLVKENNKINWLPEEIGEGRFGKWLLGARDWSISRARYWGAPIPIWKCSICDKTEILGSVSDIKEKTKSENNYFVMRHGEADHNIENVISSSKENQHHLTEKGRAEAVESANSIKDKGIDLIITSPLLRTKETAEIVREVLNLGEESVIVDERIAEIDLGELDLKKVEEYHNTFKTLEDKFEKAPPLGESVADLKERIGRMIYEIDNTYKGKNILFVTHEYPAWTLFAVARGLNQKETIKIKGKQPDFINTGEVLPLEFSFLPHNANYELDFHRPYIDAVKFSCKCGGLFERVPEVFDCWFESGSMPYGQFHYPFENLDKFNPEKSIGFPADFIAEGLDQTRGWFYTMLILGIALFDESPYKNVIVNGLVLAEDGQKMSKRLKNYPDPIELVNNYGADALRLYLLSSPVVRAEDLNFSEKGVSEIIKKNIFRLLNSVSFYEMYAGDVDAQGDDKSDNILDIWIISRLNETALEMEENMDKYRLDRASRVIGGFIDDLSTWYLRRSRDRLRKGEDPDRADALKTIRYTLSIFSKLLAPFAPFIAEDIHKKIKQFGERGLEESVHLETWPDISPNDKNKQEVLEMMAEVRRIVNLALEERSSSGIKVRQPLSELKVKDVKLKGMGEYLELVKDEINVKEISFDKNLNEEVLLNTDISAELKEEGDLRDVLRSLQDMRKEKGLMPSDKVVLSIGKKEKSSLIIEKYQDLIKKEVGLSAIKFGEFEEEGFEIEI